MKVVLEGGENLFRDWIGLLLVAIGWNEPVSAWFGGMLMAIGGASLARAWRPERDRTELWAVLGGGFFIAHMAGTAAVWLAPSWPVHMVMGVAGFVSRPVIRLALDVAEKLSGKGGRIADRVIDRVLPEDKEGEK